MLFITAGMGGGTGTGAAPIVAEIAKDLGILTVAVVTKPFPFEGKKRHNVAIEGIKRLNSVVDSLITIPNERLLSVLGKNVSLLDAFKAANNVLFGAVQGIAELITRPGLINVDFADVKTIMSEMGIAMMGTGTARGENRARSAAEAAISSPLLDNINLSGAKGVLVNITAGMDMSISEFEEVGDSIKHFTSDDATVIVGTVIDPEMSDELRVTLVATGLGTKEEAKVLDAKTAGAGAHTATAASGATVDAAYSTHHDSGAHASSAAAHQRDKFEQKVLVRTQKSHERLANPEVDGQNMDYLDIPAFLRRQVDRA
jgi:cell division protein FtsZ